MLLSGEDDGKNAIVSIHPELAALRVMTGRACFIGCILDFASVRDLRLRL